MKKAFIVLILLIFFSQRSFSQVWQWSVSVDSVMSGETNDHPFAFLWIPENCKQVRGVVVGQHNMIEEGIFEHPVFRKAMSEIGFAIVWVTPMFNINFDFTKDAGEDFNYMMKKLAYASGYKELEFAPVVPLGHSAAATYPWNFAAWDPQRTLAVISIHGDSPKTKLTGYGRANVDWGNRTIEGVPGLFVMGEYEWWEARIEPGFDYVASRPKTPLLFLADAGHGHFDYSDELVSYIALFIKKAASYRLPAKWPLNGRPRLNFIDPAKGWRMDRWRKDSLPIARPAPYNNYEGHKKYFSWAFDKEVTDATEKFYALARGKKQQYLGFVQNGEIIIPDRSHARYNLVFHPLNDGISFHLNAFFADSSGTGPAPGHAVTPIAINRICGPVKKINDTTFQICFNRVGVNNTRRSNVIWLLAFNGGDDHYKSAVQQAELRFPLWNREGEKQRIIFDSIPDLKAGVKQIGLKATSTGGVPVSFYVKAGPAIVSGSELKFTQIPPGSKYPVKVTVVAWQYGRSTEPRMQSAEPVERTFFITR